MLRYIFLFLCYVTPIFSQDYQVLGIGAPCMDIVIPVDAEFIQAIGNKGGSQQTNSADFEKILDWTKKHPTAVTTGGSSSNTIKGLASLGHICAFFGKAGQDDMGRRYMENVTKLGIKPLWLKANGSTQLCACLISEDGERTMRCYPGVANQLTTSDVTPDLFKDVQLVHIEGYMLYVEDKDFLPTAMRLAKKAGATVSFDLSSYELVRNKRERILELLKNVDIVFANTDEARELVGLVDPAAACEAMAKLCRLAVVMCSKEGCLVGSNNKLYHCPTQATQVVDCTGAGDLFASGFLHAYLHHASLELCGNCGNLTGGTVCEVHGAEIPNEYWPLIKEKLTKLKTSDKVLVY